MCVSLTFFYGKSAPWAALLADLKKSGSEINTGPTLFVFRATFFFSVPSVGDLPSGGFRVEGPCLPPYSGIRRAGVKFMRVWARMFFKKILYLTHPERVE